MKPVALLLALVCALSAAPIRDAQGRVVEVKSTQRIVAVGAGLAEILIAFGYEKKLVATDDASFPPALAKLPKVSSRHAVSAEGVIAQKPTVVVAAADAKPETAFEQIQQAGIPVVYFTGDTSLAGLAARTRMLAKLMGAEKQAETMLSRIRAQLDMVRQKTANVAPRKRVLFLMSGGREANMAAGRNSPIETMIELAGGINAVTQFDDFAPVTPEAFTAIDPDIVLLPGGGHGFGEPKDVLRQPGLSLTKAARTGSVVTMDLLYLMGYGPRLGDAVQDLAHALYPQSIAPSGGAPAAH